ncbi:MAG: cytochrome B, partial [Proteobacteria bacterium]
GVVSLDHTAAAYAMVAFLIAHVYMATMGKTPTALIKPMITGYEEIED